MFDLTKLFDGKGTYIVGAALVIYGILGVFFTKFLPGTVAIDPQTAIGYVTAGFAILTGRRALKKLEK